ncbi:unnamed protein product [Caenorhabditis brenneri]
MWNKLILTAGTESQNKVFKKQLSKIPTNDYAEKTEVVTDKSRGGSGGATLNVIFDIMENTTKEELERTKVLLVHTGGLSQRMPHLSAYGKVFATLPNHKTILETKLEIYKNHLLDNLPQTGGIMVTASDVIENMETFKGMNSNAAMLFFAHASKIEIGTQHGVFVMDKKTNKLKRVLQKPTVEEMRKEGAIREDGTVLTDSCYFLTWSALQDVFIGCPRKPLTEELCCYADFMRPLGSDPSDDYVWETTCQNLATYRKALFVLLRRSTFEVHDLGKNTFFHFGTYGEFLESILPDSDFRNAFPREFDSNIIYCDGLKSTPTSSFVEYSSGICEVGKNSVISGVDFGVSKINLPDNIIMFTLALDKEKYVSIVIKIEEDMKKKYDRFMSNNFGGMGKRDKRNGIRTDFDCRRCEKS